ncbi:MAG: NAD+ synthase [Thaumarchaeota archaeon]|nr:NAD+ synthase [Nitrososphaerota archaeon]
MAPDPLSVDLSTEEQRVCAFVRRVVKSAKAEGVVVGLSGGVDSAVTCALCVRALGKKSVVGLLMPSEHTPGSDMGDARALARSWMIAAHEVPISKLVIETLKSAVVRGGTIAKANVQARLRMTILYYYANSMNLLVAGTGDRSEIELGFFTKWGDGGTDFLPLAHLYKTQVRRLGAHLGLTKRVVEKPASPQLWPGHRARDELPEDYEKLDLVLHYLLEEGLPVAKAAAKAGTSREVVERTLRMHEASVHKRKLPPSLPTR